MDKALKAEVEQLQAKIQQWHDWERAWIFGPDENDLWPGNPGTVDPVGAVAEYGAENGWLRVALLDIQAMVDTTPIIHVHGPEVDALRKVGELARAALEREYCG